MNVFCDKMNETREEIMDRMDDPLPMEKRADEEEKQFKERKKCQICGGSFSDTKGKKKQKTIAISQVNIEAVLKTSAV